QRHIFFLLTAPPPSQLYTLSLHDALPIFAHVTSAHHPSRGPSRHRLGHGRRRLDRLWTTHLARHHAPADSPHAVRRAPLPPIWRSEEHTSELQSRFDLVCRLLLEKKNIKT